MEAEYSETQGSSGASLRSTISQPAVFIFMSHPQDEQFKKTNTYIQLLLPFSKPTHNLDTAHH